MKLNKTILETIQKQLLNFNDEIGFNKSNQSQVANKNVKDNIWLFDNIVDLDLPSGTLWCKYNIGATCGDTKESWYGIYYAWGELDHKTKYTEKNYTYNDSHKTLPLENDIAYQTNNLLRMPTKEQIEELVNYTSNEWVENYNGIVGLNGRIFTSKTNGNSIFIPGAGHYYGSTLCNADDECIMWSSSLDSDCDYYAYVLYFDSDDVNPNGYDDRYRGLSIRGVSI